MYVFTQAVVGRGPGCPDDTVVGVATPIVTNPSVAKNVPYAFSVPLYNLEPSVGEPAKFGFGTAVSTPVILDTSVRTGGDYGVVVTVPNITELVGFIGSQVTFWGSPVGPASRYGARTQLLDPVQPRRRTAPNGNGHARSRENQRRS